MTFRKASPRHPDFYPAEAAGLRWLGQSGAPVVEVLEVDSRRIVLEQLHSVSPSRAAARVLGTALARMHDAGAGSRFGAPPDGFTGQIFIGSRPMSSREHDSWGSFYIEERVEPYLRIAVDEGSVRADQLPVIERACELVASGAFDDGEPPSRIHGDLWNGNVMWTDRGAVLIDPAAHAGHRETDLAMLALFGCSYLGEILEAYDEAHALRPGWQQRVSLHQLHPLAVHAAGYGPSYGQALTRAAMDTLRSFT
ncbi:fructosamine kinase family protein [Smaragdicoccus niigatensis]|uniref:fructosamine kinase family protein n=1 Tax=Smaragdicoccus niigatensis TaxID=359359 RepID=UPI00037284DA|nr:fructosamine kinase family protein [Smaragdicoccus niigatensis]